MSVQSVGNALRKEVERLATLEPRKRAAEAQKVLMYLGHFTVEVSEHRRSAFRELRDDYGYSWGDLAGEFDITKARAQQIVG